MLCSVVFSEETWNVFIHLLPILLLLLLLLLLPPSFLVFCLSFFFCGVLFLGGAVGRGARGGSESAPNLREQSELLILESSGEDGIM